MNYVLAVLGFGLLIIVHELGHFIMAKINKVKVIEFSIGMGPKIYTYEGKETKYSIGILPIGGYVQLLDGEENIDDPGCMLNKSHIRRISIMIAGGVMNFILAIVLFCTCFVNLGYSDKSIAEVMPGSAAIEAGIQSGDDIISINNSKVNTYDDVILATMLAKDSTMKIEYKRDGVITSTDVTPKFSEEDNRYLIGVTFNYIENPGIADSVVHSLYETKSLVVETFKSIQMLISGKGNFKTDVGGPVSIVKISATAAKAGVWNLLYLVAFLSISLAVFNLLPFPGLDGGWTLILLIEMITRRKVPEKVVMGITTAGFILLMLLMLVVTIKDILFPINI